jgi:hypothetical protein
MSDWFPAVVPRVGRTPDRTHDKFVGAGPLKEGKAHEEV